ncbi:MAG: hypothetical protein LBD14_05590 [Puniceicoccales bacterium]|jgi:hypothetical protein|nr:hypothetical protein [Puniceicoccales bacterium]
MRCAPARWPFVRHRTGPQREEADAKSFLDEFFGGFGPARHAVNNKTLINASVLGLIFEKLNGCKDGSFFTKIFIANPCHHQRIATMKHFFQFKMLLAAVLGSTTAAQTPSLFAGPFWMEYLVEKPSIDLQLAKASPTEIENERKSRKVLGIGENVEFWISGEESATGAHDRTNWYVTPSALAEWRSPKTPPAQTPNAYGEALITGDPMPSSETGARASLAIKVVNVTPPDNLVTVTMVTETALEKEITFEIVKPQNGRSSKIVCRMRLYHWGAIRIIA